MGKKFKKRNSHFYKFTFIALSPFFWAYLDITFVPGHQNLKYIYIFPQSLSIFYLQKKFEKIRTKIQPVDTCPKSHLSPKGTTVLQGLKERKSVHWKSNCWPVVDDLPLSHKIWKMDSYTSILHGEILCHSSTGKHP